MRYFEPSLIFQTNKRASINRYHPDLSNFQFYKSQQTSRSILLNLHKQRPLKILLHLDRIDFTKKKKKEKRSSSLYISRTIFPFAPRRRIDDWNASTRTLPQTFPARQRDSNFLRCPPSNPSFHAGQKFHLSFRRVCFRRCPIVKRRFRLRIFINEAGIIHSS